MSVEDYNQRQLWLDVANHLTVASEAVEQAQRSLEDLDLPALADQLEPLRDQLRRAANDASEAGGR